MKFITPEINHPYLNKLGEHLDIEKTRDIEKIKQSDKALILWSPYAFAKRPKLKWKKDLFDYFKNNNKPVYIMERGALPDSLILDDDNFLNNSKNFNEEKWNIKLSKRKKRKILKYINSVTQDDNTLEPQNQNRLNKNEFLNQINSSENKIKVFVPLQVWDDTVIKMWSDWVKDVPNFFNIVKQIAKNNDDIEFWVKNHPAGGNKINFKNINNIKSIDNFHYKDCIDYCDKVLVINSGVGLQAMMWKKPVIITGKSFYYFDGINIKVNNVEELENRLKENLTINWDKILRFIYYLRFEYYSFGKMEKLRKGNKSKLSSIQELRIGKKKVNFFKEKLKMFKKRKYKIAVLITTFLRDDLLFDTLESIKKYTPKDSIVLIADQGNCSKEKDEKINSFLNYFPLKYYKIPFDSGLSYVRNFLVNKAMELNIPYCLLSADSIQFIENYDFIPIINFLNSKKEYGLVGFELLNSKCLWEFLIELTDKNIQFKMPEEHIEFYNNKFIKCDIVRNIFLAKTKSIRDLWDNDLKVGEHELAFIQYKKRNYNVYWTNIITFKRNSSTMSSEYNKYRKRMSQYWQLAKKKLGITGWVKYPPNWRNKNINEVTKPIEKATDKNNTNKTKKYYWRRNKNINEVTKPIEKATDKNNTNKTKKYYWR